MSSLLFLNPNITAEEAIRLNQIQFDGFRELCESIKVNMDSLKTVESKRAYYDAVLPILMQQFAMCL